MASDKATGGGVIVAFAVTVTWLVAATFGACNVSGETAERVLGEEGYYDIELTGWAPFQGDAFSSHWRAKKMVVAGDGSEREVVVEGVVSCGWVKGCTVRH